MYTNLKRKRRDDGYRNKAKKMLRNGQSCYYNSLVISNKLKNNKNVKKYVDSNETYDTDDTSSDGTYDRKYEKTMNNKRAKTSKIFNMKPLADFLQPKKGKRSPKKSHVSETDSSSNDSSDASDDDISYEEHVSLLNVKDYSSEATSISSSGYSSDHSSIISISEIITPVKHEVVLKKEDYSSETESSGYSGDDEDEHSSLTPVKHVFVTNDYSEIEDSSDYSDDDEDSFTDAFF